MTQRRFGGGESNIDSQVVVKICRQGQKKQPKLVPILDNNPEH